jgi:hypothetical protein
MGEAELWFVTHKRRYISAAISALASCNIPCHARPCDVKTQDSADNDPVYGLPLGKLAGRRVEASTRQRPDAPFSARAASGSAPATAPP